MIRPALLTLTLAAASFVTPASAVTEAYLKSTGSGSACTLAAPCASMVSAIAAAGAGGEVICLDKGAYSSNVTFNISQSVTISCGDGLWEAPHGEVDINTPAGADVVIEGLVIDAETSGCCSIRFVGQGNLTLRRIRSGNMIGANSHGLQFGPNGPATRQVSDSVFYKNGGSGILIAPSAGGTNAVITNTIVTRNVQAGIAVQPTGSGKANVTLDDVKATLNQYGLVASDNSLISARNGSYSQNTGYGLLAYANSAPTAVELTGATVSMNTSYGIAVNGAAGVSATLSRTRIFGNYVGLSGSGIYSFGDNAISSNVVDGVPNVVLPLK